MNEHLTQEQMFERAKQRTLRTQEAYARVFDTGKATKEDRNIVKDDLERFCLVRGDMSAVDQDFKVHVNVGKFRVWQRITGMRFPRPADAAADFRVSVERSGGLSNVEEKGEGQGQGSRRLEAGNGVPHETQD